MRDLSWEKSWKFGQRRFTILFDMKIIALGVGGNFRDKLFDLVLPFFVVSFDW